MAVSTDVIENPVSGERVVFRQTGSDTNGELVQFDLYFAPNKPIPVAHIHTKQEERFQVVSGSVRYRLAGIESDLAPGDTAVLPSGIPHTLWNCGADQAHLVVEVRPAMNVEAGLETMFGLARDGKLNKGGAPSILQGALLAREYETFLASPPLAAQRIGTAILSPIAKLFGYKARYEAYSGD
jgi:quercetin dioxygenase-like cupin family protein